MNLNEAVRGMLQHPSFSSMLAQLLIFELLSMDFKMYLNAIPAGQFIDGNIFRLFYYQLTF